MNKPFGANLYWNVTKPHRDPEIRAWWNSLTPAEKTAHAKAIGSKEYNTLMQYAKPNYNIKGLSASASKVAAAKAANSNNALSVNSNISNGPSGNLTKNLAKPKWTERVRWTPSKSRKNRKNRKATRKNRKNRKTRRN